MTSTQDGITAGKVAGWLMDLPSGKISFDAIKAQQLGYNHKDKRFKTYHGFTDLIHPDDYEQTMQCMRDHLEGKTGMYKTKYRIKAADGTYHLYMDQGIIRERKGKNISLFGATVDIT